MAKFAELLHNETDKGRKKKIIDNIGLARKEVPP
jgi:hypothetical protein